MKFEGYQRIQISTRVLGRCTSNQSLLSRLTIDVDGESRFVATPIPTVDKRLSTESEKLKGEIGNLEKRLQYLETTQKNSMEHIEQMLRGGGSRS